MINDNKEAISYLNQLNKSPYAWNNPTNLIDPDGNCPYCPDELQREIENAFMPIQDAVEAGFEAIGNLIDDVGGFINKIDIGGNAKENQPYGVTWTKDGGGPEPPTTTSTEGWGGETDIGDILSAAPGAGKFKSSGIDFAKGLNKVKGAIDVNNDGGGNSMNSSGGSDNENTSNNNEVTIIQSDTFWTPTVPARAQYMKQVGVNKNNDTLSRTTAVYVPGGWVEKRE